MIKKILIATTNPGKLREITKYLSGLNVECVSLKDVGIIQEVEEDGKSYQENSQKKAKEYAKLSGLPTISDDGGLEITALGGAPGIDSHYFAGRDGKDEDIIKKMKTIALELPENNRSAVFRSVVTFALPNGKVWSEEGKVIGIIAKKPLLSLLKGYPYRSFFYLPKINKYYHEEDLTHEEEMKYNHRRLAIEKLKPIIARELDSYIDK